jgi:signal transduction histidine kinase
MSGPRAGRHDPPVVQALTAGRPLSRWSSRVAADERPAALPSRWLALGLILRAAAATTAVALLAVHHVTDFDGTLIVLVAGYTALTSLAVIRVPSLVVLPAAWCIDIAAILVLVTLSGDWRSPFYLLSLTTLAAPAAALGTRGALLLGIAYAVTYALIAHFVGPDPFHRGSQSTVETLATHLVLPVLGSFGIGYSAETLRRLHDEQRRGQRLAIETERRRIAWDLHDSAKQRIHAAHLVLSAIEDRANADTARAVGQALYQIGAAAADMDTSLAELRSPLEGRPLDQALRERASELQVPNGPVISVVGATPPLSPLRAAHAYRVAGEAMTNAVRHARAQRVEVLLGGTRDGLATVTVTDDGCGLPDVPRPGSTGLLAMRNRARTIGGELRFDAGPGGRGTSVALRFPAARVMEQER